MSAAAARAAGARLRGFPPVLGRAPRVLVLGSMPGVASLGAGEYYAHPRNAFWTVMGELFGAGPALPYRARLARLTACGIALWDVIGECERAGSLDAAIRPASVRVNDIAGLLAGHPGLRHVFLNGATAERLFRRHVVPALPAASIPAWTRLPSTSPAFAGLDVTAKLERWAAVAEAARA